MSGMPPPVRATLSLHLSVKRTGHMFAIDCQNTPRFSPENRTVTDAENSGSYKQASRYRYGARRRGITPGLVRMQSKNTSGRRWCRSSMSFPSPAGTHTPPRPPARLVPQVRSQLLTLLLAARGNSFWWHSRARTRSDHTEVGRHRQAPAFLSEHEQRLVGAPQEGRRRLYRLVIGLYLRKQTSNSGRA